MSNNYEVGYGKPPKHTRFRKGRSGNPRGRPKGKKSVWPMLDAVLREKVTVLEGGQRKRITKMEASLKSLLDQAMKGNVPAIHKLLELIRLDPRHQVAANGERVLIKIPNAHEKLTRRFDRLAKAQAEVKADGSDE